MKIFTTAQVSKLDEYTTINEPIRAIDLMERASLKFADWVTTRFDSSQRIAVFAGYGNNGGDALAISRLLAEKNFTVEVFILNSFRKFTNCLLINLERLKAQAVKTNYLNNDDHLPILSDYDLIIDGLFGTGLTRPLTLFPAMLVQHINQSGIPVISIDIPSGLMGEDNRKNDPEAIIHASYTLTFQFPKLSFFFKENEPFTGKWEVLPIGLHPSAIDKTETPWNLSDLKTIARILKPRGNFTHKGNYGHALLVAGSYGKMGAAVLATKGCLRSGVGLLSVHIPHSGNQIMQISVPEAMVYVDVSENLISFVPLLSNYKAIGVGPGIGKADQTVYALRMLIESFRAPMVIDADALNILAVHPEIVKLIPEGSILTPHTIEFERLAGKTESEYERLQLARNFAHYHKIILVLKGASTLIAFPNGNCWFNSTGNPGMATGGSGDVLTGILTGLLAQGYSPRESALLGVYLHGLSGDLSVAESSQESLTAGDIADQLGNAFAFIQKSPDFGKPKKRNQF